LTAQAPRGARPCQYEKVRGSASLPIDLSTHHAVRLLHSVAVSSLNESTKRYPIWSKISFGTPPCARNMETQPPWMRRCSAVVLSKCFSHAAALMLEWQHHVPRGTWCCAARPGCSRAAALMQTMRGGKMTEHRRARRLSSRLC